MEMPLVLEYQMKPAALAVFTLQGNTADICSKSEMLGTAVIPRHAGEFYNKCCKEWCLLGCYVMWLL
jgi:hypothetical protein